ncbi:MAG: AAA family ATPase [Candidatus Altiarchaeota archaeon]
MKITKIDTTAFAIPADIEAKLLADTKGPIQKRYAPIGQFKVSRTEEVKEGVFIKKTSFDQRENTFYVDLSHCDMYYTKRGSVFTHKPKIIKDDFFRRIIDYQDIVISTLGQLYEYGSLPYDELDSNVLNELKTQGFIEVYERGESQFFNFLRYYLEDDVIQHKHYVKLSFHLPIFSNKRYNMGSAFELSDKVDDNYEKDAIKFNHDRIAEVMGTFFSGSVSLKGLTYLPYFVVESKTKQGVTSEVKYLVCPKEYKDVKKGFTSEVGLEPISFSTAMGEGGSVPIEASTINFSQVADLTEVKEKIRRAIVHPLKNPELSKAFQKKGGGRILFYGPPGCGKTYIARATVGECGLNFFNINTSDIISGGIEAGAKNIHEVFSNASKNAPCIIFFDEIDALTERRDSEGKSSRAVVNQFLMEMDGVENMSENVLIIGSTNAPWALDPALRRSGRFGDMIFIHPPNLETRAELFRLHTKKRPVASNVDFEKLAELTNEYSSADVKQICDDALEIPWEEAVKGGKPRKADMDDFTTAVGSRSSSLNAWYKQAEKEIRKSGEIGLFADLARHILRHAGGIDQEASPPLKFADVADLDLVKEKIRKSIVQPLAHPEVAAKYKKQAGGGMLLYGPPGCGKTYVARATAGECEAMFFNVKATDILSAEYGEPEKHLQYIFERASHNTPAIIFFDEIDALAPRRESAGKGRTLVNQFLTELDGFKERQGIMVMASTNAPWDVDPALRRAGRLTDQVYVPPPKTEVRSLLFKMHTKDKPVSPDVDFGRLAGLTEGYSSADIKALCDEAVERPWSEAVEGGEERKADLNDFLEVIAQRKSSLPPWFKLAFDQIQDSGEVDLFADMMEDISRHAGGVEASLKPGIDFSHVAGLADAKEKIKRMIVYPLTHPELSEKYDRTAGGGVLFYGPPGCGKTYLARATAGECDANFYNVKITDLLSEELGESERRLQAVFERAAHTTPAIIFFDEIDALAPRRESAGKARRLVNQFLSELDGFVKREGVMVVASTNAPWDVDPALRRAGRFTNQIFIKAPDHEVREQIFRIHAKGKFVDENLDYARLSDLTSGFSSADIKACVDAALERPWSEALSGKPQRKADFTDFEAAIKARNSTLPEWYTLALDQLSKSGEKEVYPELWSILISAVKNDDISPEPRGLSPLEYEIRETKEQIEILNQKKASGEIGNETYIELLKDLEKTLIKLEAKRND